jgi:hypothetical protein
MNTRVFLRRVSADEGRNEPDMRQRKTMNMEISAPQREVLERVLTELPREPASEPVNLGGELAQLFYHPNGTCRIMALVLSAGVDAVNGREETAQKKIERALEVINLVVDDEIGRRHVETLRNALSEGVADPNFLNELHDNVGPYFGQQLRESSGEQATTAASQDIPKDKEHPMKTLQDSSDYDDEAISAGAEDSLLLNKAASLVEQTVDWQDNESLDEPEMAPAEISDEPQGTEDTDEPEMAPAEISDEPQDTEDTDEAAAYDAAEAIDDDTLDDEELGDEHVVEPESDGEGTDDASLDNSKMGISDDEANDAAMAARAVMDAPYEEVVEAHSRRFDPERDLDPDEPQNQRRRRSKSPMGLERPRPDQVAREEMRASAAQQPIAQDNAAVDSGEPFIFVTRGCEVDELAEALLEAAKRVIRQAKQMDVNQRIRIDISVKKDTEDQAIRRRRRHRGGRRRGGGSRSD